MTLPDLPVWNAVAYGMLVGSVTSACGAFTLKIVAPRLRDTTKTYLLKDASELAAIVSLSLLGTVAMSLLVGFDDVAHTCAPSDNLYECRTPDHSVYGDALLILLPTVQLVIGAACLHAERAEVNRTRPPKNWP